MTRSPHGSIVLIACTLVLALAQTTPADAAGDKSQKSDARGLDRAAERASEQGKSHGKAHQRGDDSDSPAGHAEKTKGKGGDSDSGSDSDTGSGSDSESGGKAKKDKKGKDAGASGPDDPPGRSMSLWARTKRFFGSDDER